jgi:hypothetical protein
MNRLLGGSPYSASPGRGLRASRIFLICALPAALATLSLSCSSRRELTEQHAIAQEGRVAMRLVTSVAGVAYRLTRAQFQFSGPTTTTFGGTDQTDAVVLQGTLPVGAYQVLLKDGWGLERDAGGSFEAVDAQLASPNPAAITVDAVQTALVAYEFETAAGRISFSVGSVALTVNVSDAAYCSQSGEAVPVDDGNPCTLDVCADGRVTHTPVESGASCDDSNPCTADGTCQAGACQEGRALALPTIDACGEAWCDPNTGSIFRRRRADCMPRIDLQGPPALTLDCDQSYRELGALANDPEDGVLSPTLPAAPTTEQPGTTTLSYSAEDSAAQQAQAVRTVSVCGPSCGTRGSQFLDYGCSAPQDADFPCSRNGWQVQTFYPPVLSYHEVKWWWNYKADPNLRFANQGSSDPVATLLRSNFDATDTIIEGRFHAPEVNVKNYFGLAFGYRGPGDFYLFDWLGLNLTGETPGMSIKRVLAAQGQLTQADFWGRKYSGPVSVLEQGGQRFENTTPWPPSVDIPFSLEIHATGVRLIVKSAATNAKLVDWIVRGDDLSGEIGLYSFQGPATGFVGLTRRPLPAACSTFSLN